MAAECNSVSSGLWQKSKFPQFNALYSTADAPSDAKPQEPPAAAEKPSETQETAANPQIEELNKHIQELRKQKDELNVRCYHKYPGVFFVRAMQLIFYEDCTEV